MVSEYRVSKHKGVTGLELHGGHGGLSLGAPSKVGTRVLRDSRNVLDVKPGLITIEIKK